MKYALTNLWNNVTGWALYVLGEMLGLVVSICVTTLYSFAIIADFMIDIATGERGAYHMVDLVMDIVEAIVKWVCDRLQ